MADQKLEIVVTAKDQASKVFGSLQKSTEAFGTKLQKTFQGIQRAAMTLTPILGGIGGAFAVKKVIDSTTAFEKALADVKAVSMELRDGVEGAAEKFVKVEALAKKLGRETKFSTTEVAEGMKYVAMAGFSVEEMLKAMPGIVNAAAAANVGLAEASDWLTNILQGFNLTAKDTTRVADVIAATAANANTDMRELAEGMKFVAPVAQAAGYSLEETAAMMAMLANAGIKAGIAGRNLRSILLEYEKLKTGDLTKDQEEALESLGIAMEDLQNKTFSQFVVMLKEMGVTAGQMGAIFTKETSTVAQVIGNAGKATQDFAEMLRSAGGEAETMAQVKLNTLAGQMDVLRGSIDTLLATLGKAFLPVLIDVTKQLTNLANEVTTWIEQNPKLSKDLQDIAKLFTDALLPVLRTGLELFKGLVNMFQKLPEPAQKVIAVLGTTGGLAGAFSMMTGTLPDLIKMFPQFVSVVKGLGIALATNPIGALITLAGVATALILWEQSRSWKEFKAVAEGMNKVFEPILEAGRAMKEFFENLNMREIGNNIMRSLKTGLSGWKESVLKPVKDIGDAILNFWKTLPEKARQAAIDIMNAWIEGLKIPVEKVKEAGGWIAEKVADFLGHSLPTEGPLATVKQGGISIVTEWMKGLLSGLDVSKVTGKLSSIQSAWSSTIRRWIEGGMTFENFVIQMLENIRNAFLNMVAEFAAQKLFLAVFGEVLPFAKGGYFPKGGFTPAQEGLYLKHPTILAAETPAAQPEWLLPDKKLREAIREEAGGGSISVAFNINALDAKSVDRYIRENRDLFEGIIIDAIRRNSATRSTIRRYA